MLWLPAVNPAVLQVAVRELPAPANGAVAQPAMEVPPSLKSTLPVGATPVTVAVNVTLAPAVDGLSELVRVVVVGTGATLTTCDNVLLVDELLPESPA
jgi:hypothetical protein